MRQGIAGLISGLVIGSVLAGGLAFALDGGRTATRGVPATPRVQTVSYRWESTSATHSVDATKPAMVPATKPAAPKAPVQVSTTSTHRHSSTCVHASSSQPACPPSPAPARGMVTASTGTCDQQDGGHEGEHDGERSH